MQREAGGETHRMLIGTGAGGTMTSSWQENRKPSTWAKANNAKYSCAASARLLNLSGPFSPQNSHSPLPPWTLGEPSEITK